MVRRSKINVTEIGLYILIMCIVVKRQTKRTWWIECSTCKQWFHQRCVKISKEKAKNDNVYCFKCT